MKNNLLWKLLAINLPIIGVVIVVIWLTVDYLAAGYFANLMAEYNISPDKSHQMFLDAVHRYLIHASLAALVLAVALSFFLMRRALRPLSDMAEATRRISTGDYDARVEIASSDEVGRLGQAFNSMADSLQRVEKLRKTMVSDLAHELRTPLTNVRGYLEGLSDGVVSPSRETHAILEQEILRLVRLVEDLNQLTKADAAEAYLRREPVDLADLVEQVIALNRPDFESRCISIATMFDESAVKVSADRDKLLQVLRNLIQNAWQYAPDGGAFRVSVERTPEGVRASFANSGGQIAAEDLPFIFERFYRGEKSRSRESGGAGIGLTIVKQLIEAHGGQVGAECSGGETRFWFTLPG